MKYAQHGKRWERVPKDPRRGREKLRTAVCTLWREDVQGMSGLDLINMDEMVNGKKRQSVDDRDEMGVGKEEKRR